MKTLITSILLLLSVSIVKAQHNFDNQGIIYSKGNNVIAIGEGSTIGGSIGAGSTGLRVIGDNAAYITFGKKNDGNYQVTLAGSGFGNAMYFNQNQKFDFWAGGTVMSIKGTNQDGGSVSIGTSTVPTGYKLSVGGKIIAESIRVNLETNWPDYVFEPGYVLPSLSQVESFIHKNGHLEGVPSAVQVEKEGVSLGEMDANLLKKVEELTLYTINQQKLIEAQKKEIDELKKMAKRLEKLELLLQKQ